MLRTIWRTRAWRNKGGWTARVLLPATRIAAVALRGGLLTEILRGGSTLAQYPNSRPKRTSANGQQKQGQTIRNTTGARCGGCARGRPQAYGSGG